MVTQTEEAAAREQEREAGEQGRRGAARGGVVRLISSIMRLWDVQLRIVMVRAKMTLMRMTLFVALFAGAFVLGLMGVIFLYIGLFRLLSDWAGFPVWATFLIFAGGHLLTAAILLTWGRRAISVRDEDDDEKTGEGVR